MYLHKFLSWFQAITVLILGLGLRNTLSIIWNYPAIILSPLISHWTIGPTSFPESSQCSLNFQHNNKSKFISVSFRHTWVTFLLSTLGGTVYCILCVPFKNVTNFCDILIQVCYIISYVLVNFVSGIFLGIITGSYCCNCCKTKITYMNVYNKKTMNDLTDNSELRRQSSFEMISVGKSQENSPNRGLVNEKNTGKSPGKSPGFSPRFPKEPQGYPKFPREPYKIDWVQKNRMLQNKS